MALAPKELMEDCMSMFEFIVMPWESTVVERAWP